MKKYIIKEDGNRISVANRENIIQDFILVDSESCEEIDYFSIAVDRNGKPLYVNDELLTKNQSNLFDKLSTDIEDYMNIISKYGTEEAKQSVGILEKELNEQMRQYCKNNELYKFLHEFQRYIDRNFVYDEERLTISSDVLKQRTRIEIEYKGAIEEFDFDESCLMNLKKFCNRTMQSEYGGN